MATKTETKHSEVPAAEVVKYFVQGYKMAEGETLKGHDFFYDPVKGVFVFKLTTETTTPDAQA